MGVHERHDHGDWLESQKNLAHAVAAIYKIKHINRDYDIPDVAGYSKDRETIYIDKSMPEGFKAKSGKYYETDKYLCIHEFIEDSCIQNGLKYQPAHQLALMAEENAVRLDGLPVEEYNDFMFAQIRRIEDKKGKLNIPKDLDATPYKDEQQNKVLKQMGYTK
jgi:hypothetical protein